MAIKKFVLFIVEGINDKKEINSILHTPYFEDYLKNFNLQFVLVRNDITADTNSLEKNIQDKISKLVRDFRKNGVPYSNIKASDIDRIVHIVDLDGSFIPRRNIQFADVGRYTYEDEFIKSNDPDKTYGRNRKKAGILRLLSSVDKIDNIKYDVYFVSCNMDHMLFGAINISPQTKESLADRFVKECKEKPECIYLNVFDSSIAYECSYDDSWQKIQVGTNSLKRHTNFNLYLKEIMGPVHSNGWKMKWENVNYSLKWLASVINLQIIRLAEIECRINDCHS